jgi:uncharacterized protein (TIGR02147 family)
MVKIADFDHYFMFLWSIYIRFILMPLDIFTYIDYRKYLADFYADAKQKHAFFSYQYMAQKTMMDTSNLAKVLLGKRHLPKKSIGAFKDVCKLDDREFDYFCCMIRWAKARNEKQARELFERLINLQGSQPHVLDSLQFEYYRHWYHAAVYALLDIIEFKGNFRTLASLLTPPITVDEVRGSIELLTKLGLVTVNAGGRYVPVQKALSTGERWQSYAVHQFQKETFGLALRSLDEHRKEERDMSTLTFSASRADLAAISRLTQDYRRSIMELIGNSSGADCVYQLNCQIFPLSLQRERDHGV